MKSILYFCIASLALFACTNSSKVVTTEPPVTADTTGRKIVPWITTGDERLLLSRQPSVSFAQASSTASSIVIDTTKKFQTMDGFGYTLTGGSVDMFMQMPAAARSKLLEELFGKDEHSISVNFLRLTIGASDLSDSVYTYDEVPKGETDPQLTRFSLDKDRADVIPLIKEILAINPAIRFIATPWTPPVWMKDNGSSIGGSLKPEYYATYAQYFVKYIKEMKTEGITVHAITPQNEPLHPGNNPSMSMTAEQQRDFIKNHLGPAFKDADINTKIIVYDHNCDHPDYPLTILNDSEAKAFVDGSAFHLYAGDISALSEVKQAHPDKNVYFTEQYTGVDGSFGGDLRWHLKNLIIGAPRNWSKTVLEWNLANNVNYGPHTPGGCTTCKGALTIDGTAAKRNVAYYIIAHASKFVPYGSTRIGSNIPSGLHNVAYLTPEGNIVVIVLNDSDTEATFSIKLGDQSGKVSLPAGAAGTYVL